MRAEIAAAAASASAAAVEKVVEKVITDSEKMLAVTYLSDSSRNKSDSDYAPSSEKVKRAVAKMKQAEANAEAELKERMAVASNSSSSNGPRLTAAQINTMQTLAAREAKAEASAAAAARNAAAGEAYRRRESKKVHVNPALRNSGKHETPEQYKARVKRDAKRRLGKEKEELNRAVGGSRRTRRNGRNGRNRH
jgi:hypothetical protein